MIIAFKNVNRLKKYKHQEKFIVFFFVIEYSMFSAGFDLDQL